MAELFFHRAVWSGVLALIVCGIPACGESIPPSPPPPLPAENPATVVWNLEQKGLRYTVEADPELNRQKDVPLGLSICVYQLKDYAALQQLAASPSGIDNLLDCTVDKVDALSARFFAMQPGQHLAITADRLENARYLAVVAGYAHLKPELCVAIQPFPLHRERQGLLRTQVYSAAPVDAYIRLGAESVSLTGVERVQ